MVVFSSPSLFFHIRCFFYPCLLGVGSRGTKITVSSQRSTSVGPRLPYQLLTNDRHFPFIFWPPNDGVPIQGVGETQENRGWNPMCTIDHVYWDGKGEKERSEIYHFAGLVRRYGAQQRAWLSTMEGGMHRRSRFVFHAWPHPPF